MEYAKNPLVLDVHLDSVEGVCASRHFMGFGFSKHVPYYFPGTIMSFPSTSSQGRRVMVTGMLTACGQRSKEFAVLISFNQPIWTDEASTMFPGFNMTEIAFYLFCIFQHQQRQVHFKIIYLIFMCIEFCLRKHTKISYMIIVKAGP